VGIGQCSAGYQLCVNGIWSACTDEITPVPEYPNYCSDGIDNDCDGTVDEGCAICTDSDLDGFYAQSGCGTTIDCDDTNATVYPGATDVIDGLDNDCDGTVDNGYVSGQQVFLSSGTFMVPDGVTSIHVEMVGAGGGGGGGSAATPSTLCFDAQGGGGGGSGGYYSGTLDVTSVSSIAILLGTGGQGGSAGAPGASGGTGGDGTDSNFGNLITLPGGGGGLGGAPCGESVSNDGDSIYANGTSGELCSGGAGGTTPIPGGGGGQGGTADCSATNTTFVTSGSSGQDGYAIITW
jgi:hypothetical protein